MIGLCTRPSRSYKVSASRAQNQNQQKQRGVPRACGATVDVLSSYHRLSMHAIHRELASKLQRYKNNTMYMKSSDKFIVVDKPVCVRLRYSCLGTDMMNRSIIATQLRTFSE